MESQLHAVPWPPDHLDGLHCIFSSLEISNVSQTRVQNVAVQMWPHQCRDERIHHFPQLANAAQYAHHTVCTAFNTTKAHLDSCSTCCSPGTPGPALMSYYLPSLHQCSRFLHPRGRILHLSLLKIPENNEFEPHAPAAQS